MTLYRRILAFAFSHSRSVYLLLTILMLLFLYCASRMKVKEDILELLPQSDPYVQAYSLLLTHFQQEEAVVFDVTSIGEASNGDSLEKATDTLSANLKRSGLFQDVIDRADPEEFGQLLSFISSHQADLFGKREAMEYEKRIRLEEIRKTMEERKKLLFEMPAPSALQNFYEDPLFLAGIYLDRMSDFWSRSANVTLEHGYLYSRDLKHCLVIAQPVASHAGGQDDAAFVAKIASIINDTRKTSAAAIRIGYLSAHRFQNDNANMMRNDIQKTLSLSFIAIAVIVVFTFRRPFRSAILTLLPALFGGALATAVLSLSYPTVSAIAIGCGAMLAGIVVDFGVHFLFLVDSENPSHASQESVTEIALKLFKPMLVAAGNTVLSFLLLVTSILPGYHQLGIFAAVSIAGAFLFSMLVLPILSVRRVTTRKRPLFRFNTIYPPLFEWIRKHETGVRIAGFVWLALCVAGIPRLKLEGDVQKLNGITEETRADWQSILHSFGDINDVSRSIVEAPNLDAALLENEKMLPVLDELKSGKTIVSYQSVSTIFPSAHTQQQNADRWATFWNPQRVERFRSDLQVVCDELRMNCGAFDGFFSSLSTKPRGISVADFESPLLKGLILSRISLERNRALIVNDFRISRDEDYYVAADRIRSAVPGARLFDGDAFVKHVQELTLQELVRLGALTLIVVLVIFWLYARDVKEVMRLFFPLVATLACTFGVMGWLQIPFHVLNCIILIFIFGLVDDYCVFLHSAFRESSSLSDEHLVSTSGAITLSAITTLIGIGCLAIARHPSLHSIGVTSLLAISIGLLAVLFSLPWIGGMKAGGS